MAGQKPFPRGYSLHPLPPSAFVKGETLWLEKQMIDHKLDLEKDGLKIGTPEGFRPACKQVKTCGGNDNNSWKGVNWGKIRFEN